MSTFVMEKKVGETWIKIPGSFIGGDSSGVYPSIMTRFAGLVFDNLRAGTINLPSTEFSLPNEDIVTLSTSFSTTVPIALPTRLCFGFIMLENETYFGNADYRITSAINSSDGVTLARMECVITLSNGIVTNYVWRNVDQTTPMKISSLSFEGSGRSFPVLFAIQNTAEFNDKYAVDDVYSEYPLSYGIPAKWVVPSNFITNKLISFSAPANQFKMPANISAEAGQVITLPSYDSLYNRNYIPRNWRIENVTYPLGGTYTVPEHSVTAELVYDAKQYCGIVIL